MAIKLAALLSTFRILFLARLGLIRDAPSLEMSLVVAFFERAAPMPRSFIQPSNMVGISVVSHSRPLAITDKRSWWVSILYLATSPKVKLQAIPWGIPNRAVNG